MNYLYTCCKNCPDRTIEPNCHTTCERYLAVRAEQYETKKRRQAVQAIDSYVAHNKGKRRHG